MGKKEEEIKKNKMIRKIKNQLYIEIILLEKVFLF